MIEAIAGNFEDYTLSRVDEDTINVIGTDIDTLIDVEKLQFDDQEISVFNTL